MATTREVLLSSPVASRTLQEMQLRKLTWHQKDLTNAFRMADVDDQPLPVATW